MTISDFRRITDERIPTPNEFVAFAAGQGWNFGMVGDRPVLFADRADPLAVTFARVLSREPYRTNVLAVLAGRELAHAAVRPEPVAAPETCTVCGRDVAAGDRERLADPVHCDRGGGKRVVDGNGVAHEEARRCPYKTP